MRRGVVKPRADKHQSGRRRPKPITLKIFHKALKSRQGARVSTIIRPRAIALCKPGQSLARLLGRHPALEGRDRRRKKTETSVQQRGF